MTRRKERADHGNDEGAITYAEWVSIANYHPDQIVAWRDHEYWARVRQAEDAPFVEFGIIVLGGEG